MALGASAQNPFAYDVTVNGIVNGQAENSTIDVVYKLNAPATLVDIFVMADGQTATTVRLDASEYLTVGEHTATVDLTGLAQNTTYNVSVWVNGGHDVQSPTKVGPTYTFWSPYGIAIDNNTESKHYGRVLVTESQATVNAKTSGYWTSPLLEGVGPAIYEFTPTMERVANADGKYGFNGGLTFQAYKYASSQNMFGPKKVRITRDGRYFVGTLDALYNQPLYEVNPDDLNSWTPFFQGTVNNSDDDGTVVDGEGNLVGGPSAALAFMGEGENLKMVNLSCKGGQVFAYGRYQTFEYPIGTATSWNTAVTEEMEVMPLSLQYTISAQTVNILYDEDGGIWYTQYRASPNETQPAIKHVVKNVDGEWEEDYSDIVNVVRGGAAFSPDFKYLAMASTTSTLKIYEVEKTANGPALNEVYSYNGSGTINGFNDLAWDNAYNLYAVDNSKEVFIEIQVPNPNNNYVETPARQEFNFTVGDPTGVKDINVNNATVRKYIENGRIVIEKNGVKYNTAGQVIK